MNRSESSTRSHRALHPTWCWARRSLRSMDSNYDLTWVVGMTPLYVAASLLSSTTRKVRGPQKRRPLRANRLLRLSRECGGSHECDCNVCVQSSWESDEDSFLVPTLHFQVPMLSSIVEIPVSSFTGTSSPFWILQRAIQEVECRNLRSSLCQWTRSKRSSPCGGTIAAPWLTGPSRWPFSLWDRS